MTFTEAAVEILRLAGRPLHYKKITELAIERNLLSHVGKAPELTMSSRLATMVKKDRGEAAIVKVKPGIFALRGLSREAMALAESSEDVDLSALPPPELTPPPSPSSEGSEPTPKRALPGSDVFPAEDDDDKPILAGLDDDSVDSDGDANDSDRRGKRRRRRRGRKDEDMNDTKDGGADGAEGAPEGERAPRDGEPQQQPQQQAQPPREREPNREQGPRERDPNRDRDRNRHQSGRHDRDRDANRGDRDGHRAERDRGDGNRGDGNRGDGNRGDGNRGDANRGEGNRGPRRDLHRAPDVDLRREPGEGDLLGRDLADSAFAVMSGSEPAAASYEAIARLLVSRGRLTGEPAMLAPTVAAAIRADIARGGKRSRFRHVAGGVVLSQWYVPREVVHRERDIGRALERYVHEVRRAFLRKVQDLPASGAAELCATWLNAESVTAIRGVRRPLSSPTEMHFAGVRRRGPEEVRLAVVFLRDGREVSRERVVEMRGSAHHYGPAAEVWIVSTGHVSQGARDEASVPGALPIALFDGLSMAEAMERASIGLTPVTIIVPALDLDLLDMLRGSNEPPARDRIEPQRDRPAMDQGQSQSGGEGGATHERGARDSGPGDDEGGSSEGASGDGDAAAGAADGGADAEGEAGQRKRRRRRRGRGRSDAEGGGEGGGEAGGGSDGGSDADGGRGGETGSTGDDAGSNAGPESGDAGSDAEEDANSPAAVRGDAEDEGPSDSDSDDDE